jgi:hypothetical protein
VLSGSAPTGAWTSDSTSAMRGLAMINAKGGSSIGNHFRNCYAPYYDNADPQQALKRDNVIWCQPAADTFNAGNLGVAVPGLGGDEAQHVIIDGNPASATFGRVSNHCQREGSAVPSSGRYVKGHLVRNTDPASAIYGWRRLTTGTGHVAGTDWDVVTYMRANVEDQTITGGAEVTSKSLGTQSSGTLTLDVADRLLQHYTNGGAHTLAPGTKTGSIVVDITNNASAGAITTSGFTKVTGDAFDTTNGSKFRCSVVVANGGSSLTVLKLA